MSAAHSILTSTDLHELRDALHWLDAEILTSPARWVGTAWWRKRVQYRGQLRAQINALAASERKGASRA